MAAERIDIETFLVLAKEHPVIDVRSPSEYNHAHLPGAHSLPLFSDTERQVVGTTYKQKSRELAIKAGLDYFGPKLKDLVERAEEIAGSNRSSPPGERTLMVYCWRGGMRSAAVSWLLDLYGFRIYTLIGGYKRYRNYVLDSFRLPYRFRILGGYTGSGKTELLRSLVEKGEPVVDLEGLALHKGSAFGNIGMPSQPSQEQFENQLSRLLLTACNCIGTPFPENPPAIWLEDESQRIGQVNIPTDLWKTMRRSALFFLDIPFPERLQHITTEYGQLDRERMADAIGRITEKLGGSNAKAALTHLQSGETEACFGILLHYYDKFYLKALHNRDQLETLLHRIPCGSVTNENADALLSTACERN